MNEQKALNTLREEWSRGLRKRGQLVKPARGISCVLRSVNSGRKRYRWLLMTARGKSRSLSQEEQQDLISHLARAEQLGEEAYAVVLFEKPTLKLVVIPARRALEKKRILSRKGGIPWDE